jgi:hypothetical protein
LLANKKRTCKLGEMDEGRKRVMAIVAGVLVARHLKTADDLFDSKGSPRTESMVAAAVQWADRIMRKIDNVFGNSDKAN